MKKIIILTIAMVFTLVVCAIGIGTEIKGNYEPQISKSSETSGVLV